MSALGVSNAIVSSIVLFVGEHPKGDMAFVFFSPRLVSIPAIPPSSKNIVFLTIVFLVFDGFGAENVFAQGQDSRKNQSTGQIP